ncbi:Gfo/Idh/MocA family protein [Roseofilum casamattae]|uniref:Gfo/Idh/MocA family oxidoreductase n=1 Tax=Roseofilum casamattae BLCC-M143 TaxID=3022442 RepID=A0ABT7C346_9CYAN|nr:Gfo/Idh/MocA family oxidoreductase [Roseofilum casamattae]MDJ1185859.1 Gfo/Idh/MocA family oxidoreductase [Roseofilum casamattae BLCC-M143]
MNEPNQPLNIAVFGAGRWGNHLIRNFWENDRSHLVAIVDPNPDRLQAVQSRYNLDASVELTDDWQGILQRKDIEAVAIATPATTHYTLIDRALRENCHVLAEKPLTLDAEECLQLCHLADGQKRQLVVDHTYLFHPVVQQGKETIASGAIGELRYGYATRTHLGPVRQDVDALWDLAIHDLAIFNHWLGETPIEVNATGNTWLQPGLSDVVWVQLRYPSGFQATIHLCWLNPDKQRRLAIVGSKGTLIFDELSAEPLVVQRGELETDGKHFNPIGVQREAIAIPKAEPLSQVCNHFLDCVKDRQTSPYSSGWVGAELVRTLQAVSAKLNNI